MTGTWIDKRIVQQLAVRAAELNRTSTNLCELYVAKLLDDVTSGRRVRLAVPHVPQSRSGQAMAPLSKGSLAKVRVLAKSYGVTIAAVVSLAIAEGLRQPIAAAVPVESTPDDRRAVRVANELLDRLDEIAKSKGTTVTGLVGEVMRVVADSPETIDALSFAPRTRRKRRDTEAH